MASIEWKKNCRQNIYLTQITTYECKIHEILSIRMKAKQFIKWKYDMVQTHGQFYWNLILTANK